MLKVLEFSDLFDGLGTDALRYSARCEALSGMEVKLRGWLSPAHDGSGRVLLVNEPGACPDCSPAPVAAIGLPGFVVSSGSKTETAVKLRGTLSYGWLIESDGGASFLRLERARVATGLLA